MPAYRTKGVRTTGACGRSTTGKRDSSAAFSPDDFLAAILAARSGTEKPGDVYKQLKSLPEHTLQCLLMSCLLSTDPVLDDGVISRIIISVLQPAARPGAGTGMKVTASAKARGNLGFYRFQATADGRGLGELKFRHKSSGTVFLMYLVHKDTHISAPAEAILIPPELVSLATIV